MAAFVWEPSLVKVNAVMAAVEASCLILSVDETISMFFFSLAAGKRGTIANEVVQKTNSQSNRKHRNEAYLPERRNEHSGVEGGGCREDRESIMTLSLLHIVLL